MGAAAVLETAAATPPTVNGIRILLNDQQGRQMKLQTRPQVMYLAMRRELTQEVHHEGLEKSLVSNVFRER